MSLIFSQRLCINHLLTFLFRFGAEPVNKSKSPSRCSSDRTFHVAVLTCPLTGESANGRPEALGAVFQDTCVAWQAPRADDQPWRYPTGLDLLRNLGYGQKCATSQCQIPTSRHVEMLGCGKFLSVGGEFVVQQIVELLWACPLMVLYNMSVAGVRVVEFGTNSSQRTVSFTQLSCLLTNTFSVFLLKYVPHVSLPHVDIVSI